MATARAVIDVGDGRLTLRVGDEELVVKIPTVMKQPMTVDDSCFCIDTIDSIVEERLP